MYDPIRLSFCPVTCDALPLLHAWSQLPHVRQWWDSPDSYESFANLVAPLLGGQAPRRPFLIEHRGRPIGYIQVFRIQSIPPYWKAYEVDEDAAGIDLYIGEATYLYRGLGAHIVRRFLDEHVFNDPTITSCIVGPEPENTAAIRAYEKTGFQHLKTVDIPSLEERQYLMRLPRTAATVLTDT